MKTKHHHFSIIGEDILESLLIEFESEDGSTGKYDILLSSLDDLRVDHGIKISDWIMQLLPKTWSTSDMLYDLAGHIQKHKPNNEIDWIATFSVAEKRYLIDQLKEGSNFKPSTGSDFRDVLAGIEFSRGVQSDPEFDLEINQRVVLNLKRFGLLNKD